LRCIAKNPSLNSGLCQHVEVAAKVVRRAGGKKFFYFLVRGLPDGHGGSESFFAFCGEDENAAAAVVGIGRDFDEAAALERLESGGEGGAIHGEKGCDGRHGWRFGAVKAHEERELAVGEAEGTESFVEAAGERASGALHVETEAAVADQKRGLVGKDIGHGRRFCTAGGRVGDFHRYCNFKA
jgi:hypothetical protein